MRFIWKVLFVAIPFVGYLLYKKTSSISGDGQKQPGKTEEHKTAPQKEEQQRRTNNREKKQRKGKGKEEASTAQIISRLTKIDGVTSRVAENLIKKGIYTEQELTDLTKDELMEIRGIGPKRAAKILKL